ncbi:hypothetical protein EGN72_18850 [Pseudorhodobacter sp. E13]|nr:hypothetical protein EGN72_18850 [Pseudorhodobacter sp. E13]
MRILRRDGPGVCVIHARLGALAREMRKAARVLSVPWRLVATVLAADRLLFSRQSAKAFCLCARAPHTAPAICTTASKAGQKGGYCCTTPELPLLAAKVFGPSRAGPNLRKSDIHSDKR